MNITKLGPHKPRTDEREPCIVSITLDGETLLACPKPAAHELLMNCTTCGDLYGYVCGPHEFLITTGRKTMHRTGTHPVTILAVVPTGDL